MSRRNDEIPETKTLKYDIARGKENRPKYITESKN